MREPDLDHVPKPGEQLFHGTLVALVFSDQYARARHGLQKKKRGLGIWYARNKRGFLRAARDLVSQMAQRIV
jgi:hypothetical protein